MSATVAESTDHQQPSAQCSLCPLCCEESAPASSAVTLSHCRHQSCKACLVKWIEKEELSGQRTPPTCPFCRSPIDEQDVFAILGRSFQPRERATNNGASGENEIDELTQHWLNEHTVLCEGCGSRVEKESGCDLIECLCGWRFCYSCGAPGGGCGCNPRHVFLNRREYISDAPIRDAMGRVELRFCIVRRQVRRERDRLRKERISEDAYRWRYYANASVCTNNGRWLFSSVKNTGSIRMLTQQLRCARVRKARAFLRGTRSERQPEANMDLSWLFPLQHQFEGEEELRRFQAMRRKARKKNHKEVLSRWEYSDKKAFVCTSNGRWLFSSAEDSRCTEMLMNQLKYSEVRRSRMQLKRETKKEQRFRWKCSSKHAGICTGNGRWLFSGGKEAACVRMLTQQLDHERIRTERARRKMQGKKQPRASANLSWLFRSPRADVRVTPVDDAPTTFVFC